MTDDSVSARIQSEKQNCRSDIYGFSTYLAISNCGSWVLSFSKAVIPFLMLELVSAGQKLGLGEESWCKVGGSENKLEPTRMDRNPHQFLLPLTIMSRVSYGSWTFHHGAEHIPGPGVKEAEGKTRETESIADPAGGSGQGGELTVEWWQCVSPSTEGLQLHFTLLVSHEDLSLALPDHTPAQKGIPGNAVPPGHISPYKANRGNYCLIFGLEIFQEVQTFKSTWDKAYISFTMSLFCFLQPQK